jgi:hypothetical protein
VACRKKRLPLTQVASQLRRSTTGFDAELCRSRFLEHANGIVSHYDGTYIRMRQSKGRGNKGRQRVTSPGLRCRIAQCQRSQRLLDTPWLRCSRYWTHTTSGSRRTRGISNQEAERGLRIEQQREFGMWTVPGEGVHRSPRLLRERALHAAGNEIAAAVTRSHPASQLLSIRQCRRARKPNKNSQLTSQLKGPFCARSGQVFEKLGGRTRARTWDPLIKSSKPAPLCDF